MSAPPKTILQASPEEEAAIRAAVRAAAASRTLVTLEDAEALHDFFADPAVSSWIYDLPRPLNPANTRAWIADHVARHERGENLLSVRKDENGRIFSYSDIAV